MNKSDSMTHKNAILIPSQLLTADLWRPLMNSLGSAIDGRVADHGSLDTVQGLASGILATAPERFILFAHGMGGFIAFEMFRQQPERIEKLLLFSTLASADTPAQTARRMNYAQLVRAGNYPAVVEERIPMLLHPDRRHDGPLVALVRKMAEDTGAETFLLQQHAIMNRPDSRPSLPAIRCPTLIFHGRQDGITTMDHQQELLAGIPEAELHVIEDCGHLMQLERPELVNPIIADWIGR